MTLNHGWKIVHDNGREEVAGLCPREWWPAVMSLGSSRKLWADAAVVAEGVVLFGNLPTKTFYSDAAMPIEEVKRLTRETVHRTAACGHAHIPGSECDVLHVPDFAETIRRKVDAMSDARMLRQFGRATITGRCVGTGIHQGEIGSIGRIRLEARQSQTNIAREGAELARRCHSNDVGSDSLSHWLLSITE